MSSRTSRQQERAIGDRWPVNEKFCFDVISLILSKGYIQGLLYEFVNCISGAPSRALQFAQRQAVLPALAGPL